MEGAGGVVDPHWLAGCDSVVYGKLEVDSSWNIMWLDIASRRTGVILNTGGTVRDLSVSPDGRYLSYHEPGTYGDTVKIYDRYNQVFAEGPAGYGSYASWSPDSRKLIFVRRSSLTENGTNCRLVSYDLDSGDTQVIY